MAQTRNRKAQKGVAHALGGARATSHKKKDPSGSSVAPPHSDVNPQGSNPAPLVLPPTRGISSRELREAFLLVSQRVAELLPPDSLWLLAKMFVRLPKRQGLLEDGTRVEAQVSWRTWRQVQELTRHRWGGREQRWGLPRLGKRIFALDTLGILRTYTFAEAKVLGWIDPEEVHRAPHTPAHVFWARTCHVFLPSPPEGFDYSALDLTMEEIRRRWKARRRQRRDQVEELRRRGLAVQAQDEPGLPEDLTEEERALAEGLMSWGMDPKVAVRLARERSERTRAWLEAMEDPRFSSSRRNPAGFLRRAIESGWSTPAELEELASSDPEQDEWELQHSFAALLGLALALTFQNRVDSRFKARLKVLKDQGVGPDEEKILDAVLEEEMARLEELFDLLSEEGVELLEAVLRAKERWEQELSSCETEEDWAGYLDHLEYLLERVEELLQRRARRRGPPGRGPGPRSGG